MSHCIYQSLRRSIHIYSIDSRYLISVYCVISLPTHQKSSYFLGALEPKFPPRCLQRRSSSVDCASPCFSLRPPLGILWETIELSPVAKSLKHLSMNASQHGICSDLTTKRSNSCQFNSHLPQAESFLASLLPWRLASKNGTK